MRRRRPVDLSPRALLAAGVVGALAFSPEAGASRSWTIAVPRAEMGPGMDPAEDPEAPEQTGPLAVVRVLGPLRQRATWEMCEGMTDGYDEIEARFMAALRPGVTDVAMIVDSPGGEVAGGVPAMRRMRAAADRAGVRVWAVADECGASMGFMLLCLGDKGRVHCPPRGMTGSTGVVMLLTDMSGALEKEGVAITVVRSGAMKMKPSGIEPIDPETLARVQSVVDANAGDLAAWVAERRGLAAKDVLALQGAVLTGEEARAAGLVDGTANAHEVLAMANAEAALAALRGALGLSADVSAEQATARATEYRAAAETELPAVKAKLAAADASLLAVQAADERMKAEQTKASARATFAGEVESLRLAARVSPASAAKVLNHYDAHGEASARSTLGLVTSDTPIVLAAGAKPGAVPVPTGATALTPAQIEHAKSIGATPDEYAAAVLPAEKV